MNEIVTSIMSNIDKIISNQNFEQLIAYNTSNSYMWAWIGFLGLLISLITIISLFRLTKDPDSRFYICLVGSFPTIVFLVIFCVSFNEYMQITKAPNLWYIKYVLDTGKRVASAIQF